MINNNKSQKFVSFASTNKICLLSKWSYAYRQARIGHWEEVARDRERFKRRVMNGESLLTPILDITHRDEIYHRRFISEEQKK